MARKSSGRPPGRPAHPGILTPAEQRVLDFVREGRQNAEIGVRLGISPDAVKYHISNMLGKLHLSNRQELANWAPHEPGPISRRWAAIPALWKWTAFAVAGASIAAGGLYAAVPSVRSSNALTDGVVSIGYDGSPSDGASTEPAVSGDGRFIAFTSEATNLVPGDTNGVADVFEFDRVTRKMTRISVTSDGAQLDARSGHPAISADGRYIAFESDATNIGPPPPALPATVVSKLEDVYRLRRPGMPVLSAGEIPLAMAHTITIPTRVYLRDLRDSTTTNVSTSSGGEIANLEAHAPQISADGRYVAYTSMATNLVPGDDNLGEFAGGTSWTTVGPIALVGGTDSFVYDVAQKSTSRVSVSAQGTELFGDSAVAAISDDGSRILFISDAANVTIDQARLYRELSNDPSRLPGESAATQQPLPLPFVRDTKRGSTVEVAVRQDIVQYEQPRLTGDGLQVLMQTTTVPGGASSGPAAFQVYLFRLADGSSQPLEGAFSDEPAGCAGDSSSDGSQIVLCPSRPTSAGIVILGVARGGSVALKGYSPAIKRDYTRWTEPSISADASVAAFLVGGISVTSGSDTSDIYLVAR